MNNVYVWRGRLRKRFGSRWITNNQLGTRLRVKVGTTNGGGNLAGIVPGNKFLVGQQFSIGNFIYTVNQVGFHQMLDTGSGALFCTFNTATGAFDFVAAPALTNVYWYPCQPVMGIISYEKSNLITQDTIIFDTQFAYQFSTASNGFERLSAGAS